MIHGPAVIARQKVEPDFVSTELRAYGYEVEATEP
jgi:hypothetical protein